MSEGDSHVDRSSHAQSSDAGSDDLLSRKGRPAQFSLTHLILICGVASILGAVAGVGLGMNINPVDAREKGFAEGLEVGTAQGYAEGWSKGHTEGFESAKLAMAREYSKQISQLREQSEQDLRRALIAKEQSCNRELNTVRGECSEDRARLIHDMTTQGAKAVVLARQEGEEIAMARGGFLEGQDAGEQIGIEIGYRRGLRECDKLHDQERYNVAYQAGYDAGKNERRSICEDELLALQDETDQLRIDFEQCAETRIQDVGQATRNGHRTGFDAGRKQGYEEGYREGVRIGVDRGKNASW